MKKHLILLLLCTAGLLVGCHMRKESAYNRSTEDDYERFLSKHIFAACAQEGSPNALYSLAKLLKRPANDDPHYKVSFINGPCKGKTIWTTHVILKTEPLATGNLPLGTAVLRNYWNPKEPFNQEKTDRWHVGIVSNTSRINKGIIDLSFPLDAHDFNPAREGVYLHNVRYVVTPEIKDVRTFIH